jgi:STE24 endopeptidase
MTAIAILFSFVAFWALDRCMGWAALYAAFGFSGPSKHALLLIVSLAAGPATFFLTPLLAILSRKHEYEADAFAARATSGKAMGGALRKLNKENSSNLWPHPLYAFWYYSHPTLPDRLAAIAKAE